MLIRTLELFLGALQHELVVFHRLDGRLNHVPVLLLLLHLNRLLDR